MFKVNGKHIIVYKTNFTSTFSSFYLCYVEGNCISYLCLHIFIFSSTSIVYLLLSTTKMSETCVCVNIKCLISFFDTHIYLGIMKIYFFRHYIVTSCVCKTIWPCYLQVKYNFVFFLVCFKIFYDNWLLTLFVTAVVSI